MKKLSIILSALVLLGYTRVQGQDQKVYTTSAIEYLFSWSDVTDDGQKLSGLIRFETILHLKIIR
jgi:hypothetical protein